MAALSKPRRRSIRADAINSLIDPQTYDAISRIDLMTFTERCFAEVSRGTPFRPNWHLELMCSRLQDVGQGSRRRQIINLPPRGLKSIAASIALPAWMLGHDPTKKIIAVSYGQELADKLARDTRQVMQSSWYRRLFPATELSAVRSAVADFETTAGGGRFATSFGGAITGRGADLIVIDDPIKPEEALSARAREAVKEYLSHTLRSRFNNQNYGAMLLVMQRLHQEDLSGHLLANGGWDHLNLPAIAEEDEVWTYRTPFGLRTVKRRQGEALHPGHAGLAVLNELKADVGSYVFAAQYQQRPAPLGGGLLSLELFGRYRIDELPQPFDMTIQSWDTANKAGELNDYSVCTTWGIKGRYIYLLAVDRARMEYPKLRTKIMELRQRERPHFVLIEDGASGQQLLQELRNINCPGVVACRPQKDKAMRLMEVSAMIEGGCVWLPKDAPWLDAYETEFAYFPNGRHDDQVDSTTQALKWFMERNWCSGFHHFIREQAMLERAESEKLIRISHPNNGEIHDEGKIYRVEADGAYTVPLRLGRLLLGGVGWREVT